MAFGLRNAFFRISAFRFPQNWIKNQIGLVFKTILRLMSYIDVITEKSAKAIRFQRYDRRRYTYG